MSLKSPRSPTHQGFRPLNSANNSRTEMHDIPLQPVRSNTSIRSRRGADDEKQGYFGPGPTQSNTNGPMVAGRRRIQKELKRAGSSDLNEEPASLNAMGRLYEKIVGFSVVTRYLVYVAPVALLLAAPLVVLPLTGDGDKDRIKLGDGKNHSLFQLFLWIEVSWLTLWAGKLVAHFLPGLFMFFCGVISAGTKKYATVLKGIEIPLSLFFWGLASWLSFKFMFLGANREWVTVVGRILLSLFLSSAVLLIEKSLVQLISITYHQRSFANRIQDSKRDIHLLSLMFDASRNLFPMYCDEFAEEDYIINGSLDIMLTGGKVSGKPMKLVGDMSRFGDKITSVFGNIASEITGKKVFNPNSAHSIVVEALERTRSSEALARRIWMSFVPEGKDTLTREDIIEAMGPSYREEAEESFDAIDADQNGDISLEEMVRKIVDIGKERKAIANSMKDISQALAAFDKVLLFVVFIICIIIFLAVFQSSFIGTLTTAGTALLSLSFVFAATTQEFLGSCIFLFVKHPYDVGDRVDIAGPEKEQLVVEKISLLYTVFTRIDKMQVVQIPNIVLNNLWIENVTRSKAMKETIDVNVSFDTSLEDIELLRQEMEKFVRAPENSRDFQPDLGISVGGVGDCDKLTLKIAIKHKSNWHNDAVRAARRNKFMCALTMALKRVPIYPPGGGSEPLGGPGNPSYSVAVSDEFAVSARKKAEQDKEAKRLANQLAEQTSASDSRSVHEQPTETPLERIPSANSPSALTTGFNLGRQESHTRGRRKPGESLPPTAVLGDDNAVSVGVTLTRTSSSISATRRDHRSFDIERNAGASPDWGSSNPYAGSSPSQQQQPNPYGPPIRQATEPAYLGVPSQQQGRDIIGGRQQGQQSPGRQ